MKAYLVVLAILLPLVFPFSGYAQGNRVFSGGEMTNFNIVNISAIGGTAWSTERSSKPGYFSVVNNANYVGCTDDANIDGYIKKYGNSPFIFPVGSGTDLRTLEISAPSAITDAYATAWIAGDPGLDLDPTAPNAGSHSINSVLWPIIAVSSEGQWDWQVGNAGNLGKETTGTGAGLTITVSIANMTSFSEAIYLRLVGWNGREWIDLSGKATASGNTENNTLSGTMVAGITAVAVGKVESDYVIRLETLTANSSNCNTILNWTSSHENNADQFIIEQSLDTFNFHVIASVKANNSTYGSIYKLAVPQASGDAYYRLRMTYMDGSFSYSPIILNHNDCGASDILSVYPNPVSEDEDINLSITTDYRGSAEYVLYDGVGKRLKTKPIQITEGQSIISTSVKSLSAGTYFIIVLNQDGKQIGGRLKFLRM